MANAFGFALPGQEPTPDPRAVGQQLMQPRQQGQAQAPVRSSDILEAQPEEAAQGLLAQRDRGLRLEGGKLTGGGGDDSDGALSAAVGEALTRAGGGHQANPNPHKNREVHVKQLQQLGISELESNLLRGTL